MGAGRGMRSHTPHGVDELALGGARLPDLSWVEGAAAEVVEVSVEGSSPDP